MKILIATGIYPPEVGGPAQFARGTEDAFRRLGHNVRLLKFRDVGFLPTGIRHLVFFLKVFFALRGAGPVRSREGSQRAPASNGVQFVFSPDTFSAAVPALCAAKLRRVPIIVRTGGDFLWEWYVERSGDPVLLRDFYKTRMGRFTLKEKIVFSLMRYLFRHADAVIFSTDWQRQIFREPYWLREERTFIVENYYGERLPPCAPERKNFVASARPLKWKNTGRVKEAFQKVRAEGVPVLYDDEPVRGHEAFLEKIRCSYAVIVATIGDVSPNTILDAIRCGKPFIMTRESGFAEKLRDIALLVDPESVEDIAEKVRFLADDENYHRQQEKVQRFNFLHSWDDIARETLNVYSRIRSRPS